MSGVGLGAGLAESFFGLPGLPPLPRMLLPLLASVVSQEAKMVAK
jgi:hypothetical protein